MTRSSRPTKAKSAPGSIATASAIPCCRAAKRCARRPRWRASARPAIPSSSHLPELPSAPSSSRHSRTSAPARHRRAAPTDRRADRHRHTARTGRSVRAAAPHPARTPPPRRPSRRRPSCRRDRRRPGPLSPRSRASPTPSRDAYPAPNGRDRRLESPAARERSRCDAPRACRASGSNAAAHRTRQRIRCAVRCPCARRASRTR